MAEKNYSKREFDHFFTDITKRLEKQDEILSDILTQAKATNGRVNWLEFWRSSLAWGFGVLLTVSLFIANKLWR
jgi:hypothetical protein